MGVSAPCFLIVSSYSEQGSTYTSKLELPEVTDQKEIQEKPIAHSQKMKEGIT